MSSMLDVDERNGESGIKGIVNEKPERKPSDIYTPIERSLCPNERVFVNNSSVTKRKDANS